MIGSSTQQDSESSDSEEESEEVKILGQYNISVTLHGGFAYHLKQSRAVVAGTQTPAAFFFSFFSFSLFWANHWWAVYDFRDASTQPLTVSATSVVGDMGQTWLVGSFLVARNVFRWTQTYALFPTHYARHSRDSLAHSVSSRWSCACACALMRV